MTAYKLGLAIRGPHLLSPVMAGTISCQGVCVGELSPISTAVALPVLRLPDLLDVAVQVRVSSNEHPPLLFAQKLWM
jgi:hypothetical protein